MPTNYLHTKLNDIGEPQIHELMEEICEAKRLPLNWHADNTVFTILTLSQQHSLNIKPESIKGKNRPNGSLLKTKLKNLVGQPVHELASELCAHFKLSPEFIDGMAYYVFINRIMNPKSELRKPQPFFA